MSFSEKKYIKERARKLPVHTCLCNPDWDEASTAHIVLAKKMGNGEILFAVYLIDLFEAGLNETFYQIGLTEENFEAAMRESFPEEYFGECDLSLAHNLIYGVVDHFEEEMGMTPPKSFKLTECLLDPDLITDEIDEIKFGLERDFSFEVGESSSLLTKFMQGKKETEGPK